MKRLTLSIPPRLALFPMLGALVVSLAWPPAGAAQDKTPDPGTHKHANKPDDANKDLGAQIAELRAKVAKVESALKQGHQAAPTAKPSTAGMAGVPMGMMGEQKRGPGMMGMGGMEGMDTAEMMQMMGRMMQMMGGSMKSMGGMQGKGMATMGGQGMGGMRMMEDDMDMMGGMEGGKKGMGMMDDDGMEMMGMGSIGSGGRAGMGRMKAASALPGFPGASHIYHIGATGFFLDHPEHLTLDAEQQAQLNRIKEKALLEKATAQRKIDDAEQQLWELTGADEPDIEQIQSQIENIEKLRGDQRLAFIRAVGEAAQALTEGQRKALLGTAEPAEHTSGSHSPSK